MTDIQAAVGRAQLKRLPDILPKRRRLAVRYAEALAGIRGLKAPYVPDFARPNFQSYAVRVTPDYPRPRDELMQVLLDRGVTTRRGIMNAHQEKAYAHEAWTLPHSEAARDSVILLPLHTLMTDEDQDRVIDVLAAP
jgi:dTDP-4-amino-4,6-dideoxygalactose transaminase